MWLTQYKVVPFEVFFAIQDSIKYVQFVYLAKWVKRRHLVTIIGFWFFFLGFCEVISIMMKYHKDL